MPRQKPEMTKDDKKKFQRHIIAVPTKEIAEAAVAACAYFRGYHKVHIVPPDSQSPAWNLYADNVDREDSLLLTHISDGVFFVMHEMNPVTA